MKVMLFANTSWYLYNFKKNLICKLIESGYEVFTCAPFDSFSTKLIDLGTKYEKVILSQRSANIFLEIRSLINIYFILRKILPDFLLTFTPKGNIYPALVKPIDTRQIVNVSGLGEGFNRQSFLKTFLTFLFKIALAKSEKILFQNEEDMKNFIKNGIVKREKTVRIFGSGIDVVKFKPDTNGKFSKRKKRFLILGRIIPQKGYPLILDMINRFDKILDIAEFHILGIPDRSRAVSVRLFERLAEEAGKGKIILHKPVENVIPILNQAECLLLPSTYNEGVPRSLIEGLACGLPIITTDWKGCRDTVKNGINGFLVKPNSVDDLYEKIKMFCSLSYENILSLSIQSRKLAVEIFDENEIIGTYMEIISNVISTESESFVYSANGTI